MDSPTPLVGMLVLRACHSTFCKFSNNTLTHGIGMTLRQSSRLSLMKVPIVIP